MRLLTKNEVQDLKQKERGVEVREGAKLAQKIDVLRETATKEESKLAQFREQSLRIIREELIGLGNERDGLKKEVVELREEKERLTKAIELAKNL